MHGLRRTVMGIGQSTSQVGVPQITVPNDGDVNSGHNTGGERKK